MGKPRLKTKEMGEELDKHLDFVPVLKFVLMYLFVCWMLNRNNNICLNQTKENRYCIYKYPVYNLAHWDSEAGLRLCISNVSEKKMSFCIS